MELHVKVLAVLCIVYGAFGLVMSLLMLVVFCGVTGLIGIAAVEEPEALLAVPIIGAIGTFIIGFMLALSVPRIVAGFGLLGRRPWSRILAIVLSVLGLVNVPFGTALGAYGLWGSCRRPRGRCSASHPPRPAVRWHRPRLHRRRLRRASSGSGPLGEPPADPRHVARCPARATILRLEPRRDRRQGPRLPGRRRPWVPIPPGPA